MADPIETTGTPAVPATVAAAVPATTAPANYGAGVEGLEDIDTSDLSMPQLKIVHDQALFEDSLSGEQFDTMDVILLGLVKQRVLWPSEMGEEAEAPLCRSYNFTEGVPGEKFGERMKRDPASPLEASGYTEADVLAGHLSCLSCNLKEWGSHPSRDVPWCVEQFVLAVMIGSPDEPIGSPAMLTLQRSSIKPAKAYITSFVRTRTPLFVNRTTMSLNGQSRGTVKYSIPKFVKGVPTDAEYHGDYAELYRQVKDFVTTPRVAEEETAVTVTATPAAAAPAAAPAPAPAAATAAPTAPVVASTKDDDLPF